jgi:cyclophilin family peptidyl-prolyl cis-trans isomerase
MVTTGGTFTLKLLPAVAPRTVAQFRRLIAGHVFDGLYFYRVEKGFVAQTATADDRAVPLSPEQRALIVPIPLEVGSLHHKRGVLSLAHGDDPNSGETSFSILLGDAPHLDGKYTVFGVLDDGEAALKELEQHYDQHARDSDGKRLQILKMEILD